MSITPKGIHAIYSRPEGKSLRPVLQLLSVSMLAGQPGRYKIVLSDGEHFTTGLLSSQLISKLGGCPFKQFQLISLEEYAVNVVQEKLFLLVHGATEITPPLPTGQIGNPQTYRASHASGPVTTVPVPAVQAGQPVHSPYPAQNTNPYAARPQALAAQVNPYAQQQSPFQNNSGFVDPYASRSAPLPSHSPFAVGMAQSETVPQQPAFLGQTAGPVRYLQPREVILPMSQLTIYTQKWTIKARVVNKSEMRTFRNAKGEGQLMTVDLVDNQQAEMRATFFGTAAQKFHPMLQVGKVYTFSKGSVKPANPRFNPKAQYELMFDDHSEIVQAQDDITIPSLKISVVPIASLANATVGDTVDVAGIVTAFSDTVTVTIKSTGRDTAKRNVTVADESGCSIDLTLWGEKAERFGNEMAALQMQNPVLFAKGCRLGDFNGRTISTSGSSHIELEPKNHQQANDLKQWWSRQGSSMMINSLSVSLGSGGGVAALVSGSKRSSIQAMRSEDVATLVVGEKAANNHTVKATVVHIPVRDSAPLYYQSCATEVDDGRGGRRLCQKKAELQGDTYVCAEQHMNRFANARYILSMRIQDASGECLIRAFHDQAKSVLGADASEIANSHDPLMAQQQAVESALFKSYIFRIRSKKEIHMDEEKINMVVSDVTVTNPATEANSMLQQIRSFLIRVGA